MRVTLVGATGLVGGLVLERLLRDPYYDQVRVLIRKPMDRDHPKLEKFLLDFNDMKAFRSGTEQNEIIICTVGTTLEKVKGDLEEYRKVDFDITVDTAHLGKQGGCRRFVMISSVGASMKRKNFYLKMKGDTEDGVRCTGIESIHIMRPSLLLGTRQEDRPKEKKAAKWMTALSFLIPSKFKPIQVETVADAIIAASKLSEDGMFIHHYRQIKRLARTGFASRKKN